VKQNKVDKHQAQWAAAIRCAVRAADAEIRAMASDKDDPQFKAMLMVMQRCLHAIATIACFVL
jgi:hypothetical protein